MIELQKCGSIFIAKGDYMRLLIILLIVLGIATFYYAILPIIKMAFYLVKLRKTDGVGDFALDYEDFVLKTSFIFKGRIIDVQTRMETSNTLSDAIHVLWDNYDCAKATFDETIRIAKVNPELTKAHYIYTTDGGLIHEY